MKTAALLVLAAGLLALAWLLGAVLVQLLTEAGRPIS